jgi:predicted nucleotidyltransferase
MDANPKRIIDHFVDACLRDPRVVAAFLYGSHAEGTEDSHSDIDLGLITTDQSHDEFFAQRADFVHQLGEPVFIEDFDLPNLLFVILADGAEVELSIARQSDFVNMAVEPHRTLLDKQGLLKGVRLVGSQPHPDEQRENLRRLIVWFWHDVSHLLTAVARDHPWWAYGQLEALRRSCVSLARLRYDFASSCGGNEPYFKVQLDLPLDQLAPLEPSVVPLNLQAIREAGHTLIDFYRSVAPSLAAEHGLTYPSILERLMLERLDQLTRT